MKKGNKTHFIGTIIFAISIAFLSGCESKHDYTIDQLREIEDNSLHQNYVRLDSKRTVTENGLDSVSSFFKERYIDENEILWLIGNSNSGSGIGYYSRQHGCVYKGNNASELPEMTSTYSTLETFSYDSLIDTFESVEDPDKQITKQGGLYILTLNYEKFIKKIYNDPMIIHTNGSSNQVIHSETIAIKIYTKNGLIRKSTFSYGVNIINMTTTPSSIDSIKTTIEHTFTYSGKVTIPKPVLMAFGLYLGSTSPVVSVTKLEKEEYPLSLTCNIESGTNFDAHYFNLANYQFNLDVYDSVFVPEYKVKTDRKKYIVASCGKNIIVYNVFSLKKLYTVQLLGEVSNFVCDNGIIGLNMDIGGEYEKVITPYYYFSLDDFSPIEASYNTYEIYNGELYFATTMDNGYITYSSFNPNTHEVTEILTAKSTTTETKYYNSKENILVYLNRISGGYHCYGIDCSNKSILYEVELQTQNTSPLVGIKFDGRYIQDGFRTIDSKDGSISYFYPKEYYVLSKEYDAVYRNNWIDDKYDNIFFYDTGNGGEGFNYWLYDKENRCLANHIPTMAILSGTIIPITDDYYIIIRSEIISTITIQKQ